MKDLQKIVTRCGIEDESMPENVKALIAAEDKSAYQSAITGDEALRTITDRGVLRTGRTKTTIVPGRNASRAEAATMFMRFL